MKRWFAAWSIFILAGCGSTEPYENLMLSTSMEPTTASAGDSVRFTAEAFNPTDEQIPLGTDCGPSMDVVVTLPDGSKVSTLREMVGDHAAFTCELGPYYFADPGETERVVIRWQVPSISGDYEFFTVLRRRDFFRGPSLRFTVP